MCIKYKIFFVCCVVVGLFGGGVSAVHYVGKEKTKQKGWREREREKEGERDEKSDKQIERDRET